MVCGDEAAVGLAVRAEGPVVLSHGHRVDRRTRRTDTERPCGDLLDQIAHLLELSPQMVVYVDQVLTGLQLVRRVGSRRVLHRTGRPRRLIQQLDCTALDRRRWRRDNAET